MRRILEGKVVRKKQRKTIGVEVVRLVRHPLYHKVQKKKKLYFAHDEREEANLNDLVKIIESRPYSKLKKWRLLKIIGREDEKRHTSEIL